MRIIFVRHGHPNYEKDCLTELGHLHAQAAAKRLEGEGIDKIYSSTCGRAFETAEYTARLLGQEVEGRDFMREIKWGSRDGTPVFADGHPWTVADQLVNDNAPLLDAAWENGAMYTNNKVADCVKRMGVALDAWLEELGYRRDGLYYRCLGDTRKTVAVFCHGGASSAMFSHLFNLPFPFCCAAMGLDYTGITVVTLADDAQGLVTPRFEMVNDARHIQGLRVENIFGR